MTDQKTPLKDKASTAWEIRKNVSVGMGNRFYMHKEWVLLSDAEAEIRQLNTRIETANQRLEEEKEFLVYRTPLVQDLKKILGEKTET